MTRAADRNPPALSLSEWAALALICEADAHGWVLVRALAHDGEIGSVWTVRRALVYRSLDGLAERGLIAEAGSEASDRGPERTIFAATPAGRRAVREWLTEPVAHVRDLRSELLLKLVLARRAGVDERSLLDRQRTVLEAIEGSLAAKRDAADGADELLLGFRLETTRAALRFVETERSRYEGRPTGGGGGPRRGMVE